MMCYPGVLWRDWPQILTLPSRSCQLAWGGWAFDHNCLSPPALSDSVGPDMEPLPAPLQSLSRACPGPETSLVPHTQTAFSHLEHLPLWILIWVLLSISCKFFSSMSWLPSWIFSNLRARTTDESWNVS